MAVINTKPLNINNSRDKYKMWLVPSSWLSDQRQICVILPKRIRSVKPTKPPVVQLQPALRTQEGHGIISLGSLHESCFILTFDNISKMNKSWLSMQPTFFHQSEKIGIPNKNNVKLRDKTMKVVYSLCYMYNVALQRQFVITNVASNTLNHLVRYTKSR